MSILYSLFSILYSLFSILYSLFLVGVAAFVEQMPKQWDRDTIISDSQKKKLHPNRLGYFSLAFSMKGTATSASVCCSIT
jgi:hypothetical protein